MPEPIDFTEYLAKQRDRLAKLQVDARQAVEQARKDYREWEQGKGQDVVGLTYPWDERPIELPLGMPELELAFKLAKKLAGTKGVFAVAARILKVSEERLDNAAQGTQWQRKRKPKEEGLISARREGLRTIVKIKRPPDGTRVSVGSDEQGNFLIIFDEPPRKGMLKLIERAKQVLKESSDE